MRFEQSESDLSEKIGRMRRTSEMMFPLVREFEASGLSKVAYCELKSLHIAVFSYWYRKYEQREHEADGGFVEVPGLSESRIKLELECGRGRLIFYELPPASYVEQILGIK